MTTDLLGPVDAAPRVSVVDGEVVASGERVCVAFTPRAARIAGESLIRAAEAADAGASNSVIPFPHRT